MEMVPYLKIDYVQCSLNCDILKSINSPDAIQVWRILCLRVGIEIGIMDETTVIRTASTSLSFHYYKMAENMQS
jgi:hypothetical protein